MILNSESNAPFMRCQSHPNGGAFPEPEVTALRHSAGECSFTFEARPPWSEGPLHPFFGAAIAASTLMPMRLGLSDAARGRAHGRCAVSIAESARASYAGSAGLAARSSWWSSDREAR